MTLVVAQQGGTIATQRNLIQLLWDDSKQLNRIRVQELTKQHEKMYLTDPQYTAPEEKPPAAKAPAPPPETAPTRPAPTPESPKPARVLWQI